MRIPRGGVTTCSIGVNGTLSLCTQRSGLGTAGIAANASFAYVSVDPTTVDVCAIGASGGLANCASAGGIFSGAYGITLSGGYAYIANQGNGTVSVCSINPVGTFAACAASNIGGAPTDVVIKGSQAYVNDGTGNIDLCSVDAVGAMTNCVPSKRRHEFQFWGSADRHPLTAVTRLRGPSALYKRLRGRRAEPKLAVMTFVTVGEINSQWSFALLSCDPCRRTPANMAVSEFMSGHGP